MPKLSIIIPTFNSASTIQQCLRSIACQSFVDYEIVIQDGMSSDQTVELIHEFQRSNPRIIVELRQESDKGIYDAMNKAMRRARGAWLYFLGSDDELYDENVLSRILGSPDADCSDVLYGNVLRVNAADPDINNTVTGGVIDLSMVLTKPICHQGFFYRSAFTRRLGDYNEKYPIMADRDFTMRCWAKGGRFKYVDVIIAKFSYGGISSQVGVDQRFRADLLMNIIRYFWKSAGNKDLYKGVTPSKLLRAIAWSLRIFC